MTDIDSVVENETTVPLLPCSDVSSTLEFLQALGFQVTYEMTRPYLYLAFRWRGVELHYGKPSSTFDPAEESSGCLVMVDTVAPYHHAFTRALRATYGKVLAKGAPRITRFRPGQSRFTVVDPSGNNIIFIQRDEPEDLEYGGSKSLKGLARVVDNARILREFKNDDRTAARVLDVGLRRFPGADAVDLVKALTARAEIAVALGETEIARKIRDAVDAVTLGPGDAESLADELDSVRRLEAWLTDTDR